MKATEEPSKLEKVAKLSFRLIFSFISVITAGSVWLKILHHTAFDAQARAIRVEENISGIEARISDKVADRMLLLNNNLINEVNTKFESINKRLIRIEHNQKLED